MSTTISAVETSADRLAPQDSPLTSYGRIPFEQRRANASTRIVRHATRIREEAPTAVDWAAISAETREQAEAESATPARSALVTNVIAGAIFLIVTGAVTWYIYTISGWLSVLDESRPVPFQGCVAFGFLFGLLSLAVFKMNANEMDEQDRSDRFTQRWADLMDERRASLRVSRLEDVCVDILRAAPARLRDLGAPEDVIARAVALRDAPTRKVTLPNLPDDVPEEFRAYVTSLFTDGPRQDDLLNFASQAVALIEEARIAIIDSGRPDPGPATDGPAVEVA